MAAGGTIESPVTKSAPSTTVVAAASGHEVWFRRWLDSGGDRDTTPVTFLNCFFIFYINKCYS